MSRGAKGMRRALARLLLGSERYRARRARQELARWEARGRPVPTPHALKAETVRDYAERFALEVMIETGTYRGDMIAAIRSSFDQVHSIELDEKLRQDAAARFARDAGVCIHQGNSGERLGEVLIDIQQPCLFWLDGHWSGGETARGDEACPIRAELRHIFDHATSGHVLLIDDARCFDGTDGYPTHAELRSIVAAARPDWVFDVEQDIIRCHAPWSGDVPEGPGHERG